MISQEVFFDMVVAAAAEDYQDFYDEITKILESSAADAPTSLSLAWRAFPIGRPTAYAFPEESSPKLFGLKLTLRCPLSPAHRGWIAHAVIGKLVGIYGDFHSTRTWVGSRQDEAYVTHVSLEEPASFFCAVGEHAEECLWAIVEAERSFDPAKFDEDGYYIDNRNLREEIHAP